MAAGVAATGVADTGVAATGVAATGVADTGVAETGDADTGADVQSQSTKITFPRNLAPLILGADRSRFCFSRGSESSCADARTSDNKTETT
jgi:hypothetical protein